MNNIFYTFMSALHLLVSKLVYPVLMLNTILTNILFPHGKINGVVRSRTRFILSSRSWETGSHPTGCAGRMKLSYVVPLTHISKKGPPVFIIVINIFCAALYTVMQIVYILFFKFV